MLTKLNDSGSHEEHILDEPLNNEQNVSAYKNLWLSKSVVISVQNSTENERVNIDWVVLD
jgi:hypothetical protein